MVETLLKHLQAQQKSNYHVKNLTFGDSFNCIVLITSVYIHTIITYMILIKAITVNKLVIKRP